MKSIYTAPSVEAAEIALKDLDAEWGRQYPGVIDVWRRAWPEFIPFLDYPPELRRIVYTTDEIVKGPGSDLSEELAVGVGPAALDCRVAPGCPPGPAAFASRSSWR